jgi:3-oxoacyl-(acyl-carrier-protein) synthase
VGSNDRVSVVVTGLGATTPLGGDAASTWSAMLAGTSGVRRITEPWVENLPVKIAAPAASAQASRAATSANCSHRSIFLAAGQEDGPVRAVRAGGGTRGLGRRGVARG